MEILFVEEIDSTHRFLLNELRNQNIIPPFAVIAKKQTAGIGSRENNWIGCDGNLFLSFCIEDKFLPSDLPTVSASIYFSSIMKNILYKYGSKVWLKWPNDFYLQKKIGGTITTKIKNITICSIGLNTNTSPEGFEQLDIEISNQQLAEEFIKEMEKQPGWKETFSNYELEFYKSKKFIFHNNNESLSLESALLNGDGSIEIFGKKVYSAR